MRIVSNSKNFQKILEFPDNRLIIDLCGQLDSNLSRIEHAIPVQIIRRGNIFEVSGEQDDCGIAETILQGLYSQLESGKSLDAGDIEAVMRMPGEFFEIGSKKSVMEGNNQRSDQGPFEIKTRKKSISPRTISQPR